MNEPSIKLTNLDWNECLFPVEISLYTISLQAVEHRKLE